MKDTGRRRLVDSKTVAEYLGLPRESGEQQLNRSRCEGTGAFASLSYFKVGKRVRYDLDDVDHWLDERRHVRGAA